MSTDQPGDPFRKKEPPGDGQDQGQGEAQGWGEAQSPGRGHGQGQDQGRAQGREPPAYGGPYSGGPYDSGPYASNPYGGINGATDPLAGMPPLASRGRRLLARIVDALLIGIPVGLIMTFAQGGWAGDDDGRAYGQQAVYTLVYLVYEGLMLTNSGQTLGKKLMRIRVAMLADGAVPRGTPGWLRAAVYSVPPLVPCVGFLFWLANVLFCTWDKPYQQCLHDKAVKTVVVAAD
ncbi:RDD family protein [Streptomyces marispadix]|uniref:RDD family protein n=1 Tax=Streptomyces marispadix TaxID=2922868 RepID=A0ABS9SWC2_9ACTN|nr:RDD family protein [Streptomyces marispadix]MCH6160508.1 RDD family protein [Streptomyces marispadix]